MKKQISVAIAGNPNSGKSTIFNMLTGSRQKVGNYPGVTVEKKEGQLSYKGYELNFIDLPGTYSLATYSLDEIVARNYLIEQEPDVVINVVDCSNIERNLFLTTQLMELDLNLILDFNMSDIARQKGLDFDLDQLSKLLQAPIVPTVGRKEQGAEELLDKIIEVSNKPGSRTHKVHYGSEIEDQINSIEQALLEHQQDLSGMYNLRWLAIKLLENDSEILAKIESAEIKKIAEESRNYLKKIYKDDPENLIADSRFGFISGACQETVQLTVEARHNYSDIIDAVVTNKILGLPIFLFLMYLVFQITFSLGQYPMDWLETFFNWLSFTINTNWPFENMQGIRSLITDGIIGGVGGVLVFLPNILILFAAIALLEGTGYMARAAFIMDRIMHKIGLHGKSFIPMIIGFGCSVPAIMSTRILENRRNRIATIMVIPLMSCGARLTIYALLIPAFFEKYRGLMLFAIYIIGILLAIVCCKILRKTLLKGESEPFVMELPPYRMPTAKSILLHTWHRGKMYLKKAGTIILAISIVLWFAANFPKPDKEQLQQVSEQEGRKVALTHSVLGRLGKAIEPAIEPLGFDWKIGTALVGATAAKEVFVSQMGVVYAVEGSDESNRTLREKLQENYSRLTAFCIMLFCLIYSPCFPTIAITRQETASWKWALLQSFGLTVIAYILTLIVYQVGKLLLY